MAYYYTNCWKEINPEEKICRFCSADQNELAKVTFIDKLIKALNHPEPETSVRAASIPGEKRYYSYIIKRIEILDENVESLLEVVYQMQAV